jgi:hypothetical protein
MTTAAAMKPWRTLRRLAGRVLVAALMLTPGACSRDDIGAARDSKAETQQPPVILVGIDGLEWTVVEEMLAAGRLPVLQRILERGSYGKLSVYEPTLSPMLWTTIATGTMPDAHGIRGFLRPGAGKNSQNRDGAQSLYTSADRRRKAFWNVASDADLATWVIGWWLTFPVEPIDGIMVAQVNTVTPAMRRAGKGVWKGRLVPGLEGQVHPREIEGEVLGLLPQVEADLGALETKIFGAKGMALKGVPRRLIEQSRWALLADSLYVRVARELLGRHAPPAALAIYLGGPDVVGHRFWRYMEPRSYDHPPSEEEVAALGDVIRAYYAWTDQAIGALLAEAPTDSTVIVVSDHGMHATNLRAHYRSGTLSGGHLDAPPAFFAAAGPKIRKASSDGAAVKADAVPMLGSVLDVAPTLLALLGTVVGSDMKGRVLDRIIEPAFLKEHPMRFVDRVTPEGWRPEVVEAETPASGERIEQLRELGYLD